MKFEYFLAHLYGTKVSRREALKLAGKAGAAGLLAYAGASRLHPGLPPVTSRPASAGSFPFEEPTDDMFDVDAVENGAWSPGPYGLGDQRGTFNEVTPEKTAEALRMLANGRPVKTYNLGELLVEGFPAFPVTPPREYKQRLFVFGYEPGPGFRENGGIVASTTPLGANRLTFHEERLSTTYQIATQLDGLNHVGVGRMYYNGHTVPEMTEPWGTSALGNEHMGPIVTRGILLDILGLKISQGATSALSTTGYGLRILRDNYRITLDDIREAMRRAGIGQIRPGDVVLFRTGWTHLASLDPSRYLRSEPGIYLREARFLGNHRPAIIGSDTWGLEVVPGLHSGIAFPVHQLLFLRYGIRIGEGIRSEDLAEDGVYEFVFIWTPQYAKGATGGNTAPAALGQPRPGRRARGTP